MPYIKEEARLYLNNSIENICNLLTEENILSDDEYISILREINYIFSSILVKTMGKPSYSKIAMITGVLENIKQEFYRRVASPYEDDKIIVNGDISEYKKIGK